MNRQRIVVALVYTAAAVACTQIPLLNSFGFEYAFLFGLITTCTAGPLAISMIRPEYQAGGNGRRAFIRALLVNLGMLGIPLAVLLAAAAAGPALGIPACSPGEGIAFFFLLPAVTAPFATAFAYFCTVHYRRPHLIYWLAVVASAVYALALGYFTPAIFSYNFFYGYFPGITYDELLPLTLTLVLFRVLTLLCAGLLVWMTLLLESHTRPEEGAGVKGTALLRALAKPPRIYIAGGATVLLLAAYMFRCDLGFETTEAHLRQALPGTVSTKYFVIHYAPESCDSSRLARVTTEHEFLLARLMDLFSLSSVEPIHSYLYPSNDSKQTLIGAGSTSIAKPWTRQLHISMPSLDGVLDHELVHVVAGRFGQPIIRANLSTGLVEGLAMALELPSGERTPHQYAAAMRKQGVAPDIASLMSFRGFAVHSSAVSYVLAGSFCRYLVDRYGIRRIAQVYGGSGYDKVYGRPLDALIEEWNGFLDRIPVNPEDTLVVDAFFRRPGMFGKICPRVVARRNREAAEAFAQKQYETAASRYHEVLTETGSYEALSGYLASTYRLKQYDVIKTVWTNRVQTDPRPARYLPLFILFGDAFWGTGDTATARSLYHQLASVNLTAGLTEQALVRLGALTETKAPLYFDYLTADTPDSIRITLADSLFQATQESPLALHLRGRAAQRLEKFEDALVSFRDVDDRRFGRSLRAARLRAAGECLFRLGRYQEARVAFWESLNHLATEARQEQVNGWVSRCEWMAAPRND